MKSMLQINKIFKSVITPKDTSGFTAILGNAAGVVQADDHGGVYCMDFDGNVFVAYNDTVPLVPRRLVKVGYKSKESRRLEVLRFRDDYPYDRMVNVPAHADYHQWPGVDTLWVRGEQLLPGLAIPSSGMVVSFVGFVYFLADAFHLLDSFDLDLTSYIPASGAQYGTVVVDDTGAVSVRLDGTKVTASRETLEYEDIPVPAANERQLFAVKLYDGQTKIIKGRLDTDIIDLRWSWGAGGGGGGSVAWIDITGKPDVYPPDTTVTDLLYIRPAQLVDYQQVLVEQDLTDQVDGVTDHFSISVLTAPPTVTVYLNGLRQRMTDITLDGDLLGFTLAAVPDAGDILTCDFLAIPLTDGAGNILTDASGYILTE